MKELILVCEDLFGLEVFTLINQINARSIQNYCEPIYHVIGYISNVQNPFGIVNSPLQRLGTIYEWKHSGNAKMVLGMSSPKSKIGAVKLLKAKGANFQTIVAPSYCTPCVLPPDVEVGEGSVFSAYNAKRGLKVGRYVTVIGAMLSGKAIEDYSTVLRFSNIAGVSVGKNTYVGNHVFLPVGKKIGDDCFVADGSIIVNNIKSNSKVKGVPAKKDKTISFYV